MTSGTFLTIIVVVCAVLAALWIALQVWREQMDMKQVMAMVAAQADELATTVGGWYGDDGVQEYVATIDEAVSDDTSSDDWKELCSKTLPASSQMSSAQVTWKDDGESEQKGTIRAVVVRDDEPLQTLDLFGVAPSEEHTDERQFELSLAAGDTVRFEYKAGSGGSHTLAISAFVAVFHSYDDVEAGVEEAQPQGLLEQEPEQEPEPEPELEAVPLPKP
eukprot:COSAG02_NODE_2223_length_9455_cov_5.513675_11_plen_219_part_00